MTFLASVAGVERVAPGWVARWAFERDDHEAAELVIIDVLDMLEDLRRSAA